MDNTTDCNIKIILYGYLTYKVVNEHHIKTTLFFLKLRLSVTGGHKEFHELTLTGPLQILALKMVIFLFSFNVYIIIYMYITNMYKPVLCMS